MKQTNINDFLQLEEHTHKLEKINLVLEQKIAAEVTKSRVKDELMFQQSKLASMGEMIENIAHQWRQPLMEISSLFIPIEASLHLEKKVTNMDLLDKIEKLNEITTYMSQTIDDFKNFFATEKEKTNFKISEQINTSVNIIASGLKINKIDLDIIIKNNPTVSGYKNEYSQVLINILTNAKDLLVQREIKYPKIVISIEQNDDNLIVSIIDNAGGIKVKPLKKIFEPFYTSGKIDGSGIGLFMSKLIVENNMKGTLSAENCTGGAKFTISIPIK